MFFSDSLNPNEYTSFDVQKYPNVKEQLVSWANRFPCFAFYDSHAEAFPDQKHSFDFLIGIDFLQEISTTESNEIPPNRWAMGYFAYEYNSENLGIAHQNEPFISWKNAHFFEPRYLIFQRENRLYFNRNYPEAADLFTQITQIEIPKYKHQHIEFQCTTDRETYRKNIAEILHQIRNGEFYELNYCIEFRAENVDLEPIDTFLELNRTAQNPMTALLKLKDRWALSFSPERLLKKEGKNLIAQPMKGTAPRDHTNPENDKKNRASLQHSEKERAENLMIADLMRNDLTPYAQLGSVQVSKLCEVVTFPQVFQMISTVEATLDAEKNAFQALKNTLPAGSMTGAPKINTMRHIERLENFGRGLYSGAIGYFAPNGDFDFNVVIRSLFYDAKQRKASFAVGGAITIQSTEEFEYEECMIKTKFLLNFFLPTLSEL